MPQPRIHALPLLTLAAGVGLVYANSLQTGFVFDSRVLVLENPRIREATLPNLWFLLTRDYWQPMATDGLYRPLTTLSYLFNYAVLGNADRPAGYHVVNLLLHLGCVGLVYSLMWHLVGRRWPAVVAAALFGVHPITSEVVTNIAGRADLLAALGVLGGLVCHVRAVASTGWRRSCWSLGVLVGAVVAYFSKEHGLVLLVLLAAYDLICTSRWRSGLAGARRFVRGEHLIAASVLAAYGAARWYAARIGLPPDDTLPIDNPILEAGVWTGRLTAVKVLGREVWLLLWPATLSADYSYRQIPVVRWPPSTWEDWQAMLALGALVALAWVAFRLRRA